MEGMSKKDKEKNHVKYVGDAIVLSAIRNDDPRKMLIHIQLSSP